MYPGPESNRHVRRHWCLRPTRLPIPPPGLNLCFSNGLPPEGSGPPPGLMLCFSNGLPPEGSGPPPEHF